MSFSTLKSASPSEVLTSPRVLAGECVGVQTIPNLDLIAVQRPYFNLTDAKIVARTPVKGNTASTTIRATFTPDTLKVSRGEVGQVSYAEVARHASVTASLAAADANPTKAKHYYVVTEVDMTDFCPLFGTSMVLETEAVAYHDPAEFKKGRACVQTRTYRAGTDEKVMDLKVQFAVLGQGQFNQMFMSEAEQAAFKKEELLLAAHRLRGGVVPHRRRQGLTMQSTNAGHRSEFGDRYYVDADSVQLSYSKKEGAMATAKTHSVEEAWTSGHFTECPTLPAAGMMYPTVPLISKLFPEFPEGVYPKTCKMKFLRLLKPGEVANYTFKRASWWHNKVEMLLSGTWDAKPAVLSTMTMQAHTENNSHNRARL